MDSDGHERTKKRGFLHSRVALRGKRVPTLKSGPMASEQMRVPSLKSGPGRSVPMRSPISIPVYNYILLLVYICLLVTG